ncbi:MAG: M14 family zinc carboxypeptidase [Pararobbsia sp.]
MSQPASRPDSFAELDDLLSILSAAGARFSTRTVCEIQVDARPFPLLATTLGSDHPQAPRSASSAACMGSSRSARNSCSTIMRALLQRLEWDELLLQQLRVVRLVFMPIVNPGGMWAKTRSNPNGVDLMRNAPQNAEGHVPFLAGGQRIGPWLPWYRGAAGAPMEPESLALLRVVKEELMSRPLSFAVDCHSGFGWGRQHLVSLCADRPQDGPSARDVPAQDFVRTGLPASSVHLRAAKPSIPSARRSLGTAPTTRRRRRISSCRWTLELGSWRWIRKNPTQLFSRVGIFNPVMAHRTQRVLRRHVNFLDFLTRAAFASHRWLPQGAARQILLERATQHWQRGPRR